jgi:sirohydrochlorin cobaltochelatase
VTPDDFTDATLVLLGHGSTQNRASAAPVYEHAARLRQRKLFAEVREAFWKQEPQVTEVLAQVRAPRLFIAPLFISEGYFSEDVIPRELGFRTGPDTAWRGRRNEFGSRFYCRPVGTHAAMTDVVLARAAEVVRQFPFPGTPRANETTLLIAGHGTTRQENSRQAIEDHVARIRGRNEYAAVDGLFLEEEPRIAAWDQRAPTRHVVLVPFFMSDGHHVCEDIPVLLGEPAAAVRERVAQGLAGWRNPTERRGKLVWYSSAAGTESRVAEVILARVREAARQPDQ